MISAVQHDINHDACQCQMLPATIWSIGLRRPYRSSPFGLYVGLTMRLQRAISCHPPPFSTRPMSQTHPNTSSSSYFQSILNAALEMYEEKTKSKLLAHPIAAKLQSCDSPTAILSVLQDLVQQFDRRRRSDQRLTSWLHPTVNVLHAFSSAVGPAVGHVSPISPSF